MLFHRVRESLGPWLIHIIHAEAAVFNCEDESTPSPAYGI